jgi:hypothetical protein
MALTATIPGSRPFVHFVVKGGYDLCPPTDPRITSDLLDLRRLRPLLALFDIEFDLVAFGE